MERFILICLVFIISLKSWSQNDFVTKSIEILQNSDLSITGDTNISMFECDFNTFFLEQGRQVIYHKSGDRIIFKSAILSLRNEGFDCGNKVINKDFHSLLKTNEYPKITLELLEINLIKADKGKASVRITIAGKEKKFVVPIDILSSSTHRFIGKLKLDIQDFGLEPPKKMFGLIVIKKEVEINFNLAVAF